MGRPKEKEIVKCILVTGEDEQVSRDGDTLSFQGSLISGVLNTQKDAPLMESCATLCGLLNFMMHYSVTLASYSQVLFPIPCLFPLLHGSPL